MRLDLYLYKNGFCKSRSIAQTYIESGAISLNGKTDLKSSIDVGENDTVEVLFNPLKYVSRGGLKLEKALDCFSISVKNLICADIGASTGGFSDCLLQNGASKVYAIDSGSGQLDPKIANDPRVVNMEKTNFRTVENKELTDSVDFAVCDVSFISLKNIAGSVAQILKDGCGAVFLIKPQFEAGKQKVGKNGIVRDKSVHISVICDLISYFTTCGLTTQNLTFSPICGQKGNIEYLLYLKKSNADGKVQNGEIENTVNNAFLTLKR